MHALNKAWKGYFQNDELLEFHSTSKGFSEYVVLKKPAGNLSRRNHFFDDLEPSWSFSLNTIKGSEAEIIWKNGHFFFGEKIGEGILENCPLQKKGIFQVKRWGFWPPQKPYLKAAWHEESVQESSHLLGNLDFRCPNVRDPLNWLTFVCWKPIFLVVISVRSCSPMLTEQCWTTMGRTERHRGPKMLSCSVVFFPQAGMVSSLKLGEEQIF